MKNYIFKLPTKIYFGENAAMELKDILTSYGITKVMIVTDPGIAGTESFQKLIHQNLLLLLTLFMRRFFFFVADT